MPKICRFSVICSLGFLIQPEFCCILVGNFFFNTNIDKSYAVFIPFVLIVISVSCSGPEVVLYHYCFVNVVFKGCLIIA